MQELVGSLCQDLMEVGLDPAQTQGAVSTAYQILGAHGTRGGVMSLL